MYQKRTYPWMAVVTLALGLAAPAAGFDLAAWSRAVDHPTPGGTVELAGPLAVGSATLEPLQGCTVRELVANGERCGLLFEGPVKLTFTVADRFSVPVARRNLKKNTKIAPKRDDTSGLEIVETLRSAVVWGFGLTGAPAAGEAATPGTLPEWVEKILDRPLFAPPSHDLAQAAFGGAAGMSVALLRAPKDTLLLRVDPTVDQLEELDLVMKIPSRDPVDHGRRYLLPVAAQPIGRQWWDRPGAPLMAVREELVVDNSGGGSRLQVTSESTVRALRAGAGLWRVDLVDRMVSHREELPVEVRTVQVNGKPAPFLHQDGELLVRLDPPPPPGGTVRIRVVHDGHLALRPGGDSYWSLGTWAWYPQPAMNAELAEVDIRVVTPEDWTAFASGDTVSRETADGLTTLHTHVEGTAQFPVVAAGKYHVYSDTRDGITCNVATYVFGKEKAARLLIDFFFAAAKVYNEYFHVPYPYTEMDIVEINSWGWGQAPPGVIFITREAFTPLADSLSQIFSQGINERIAHEMAHTWWGHVVKMDSTEEQWITESFAEYSAALFLEVAAGSRKKGQRQFTKLLNSWKGNTSMVGRGGSIYLGSYLAGESFEDRMDGIRLLYAKGPMVLHALRLELQKKYGQKQGDRYFIALLRAFLRNFEGRYGATRHLVGILDQITGESWQGWFERYVYGCEVPKL